MPTDRTPPKDVGDDAQEGREEAELKAAIDGVLRSASRKKLVVAGPGTGKTTLFKQLLEGLGGSRADHLVLTFLNNLKKDLESALANQALVSTLHSYCLGLLYNQPRLRVGLSPEFRCVPRLAHLISRDWEYIRQTEAPHFVGQMRTLEVKNDIEFYIARGNYYDAVDFDDSVYRVYKQLANGVDALDAYELVLIDEYQDFNGLEAAFIERIAAKSPILIAGDDDQALYSQLRSSSWDHIRSLYHGGEYEVFELPFCLRCPKVIVDAVNDVIAKARETTRLVGRLPKPYRHYPPVKGADSEAYPTIALVRMTLQRANANYMGRYVAQVVDGVPVDQIKAAAAGDYPSILVIVAQPYRAQIVSYLEEHGYAVDTKPEQEDPLERGVGVGLLKEDPRSNLGWRIVLGAEPDAVVRRAVRATADMAAALVDVLPEGFRQGVLAEVEAWEPVKEGEPIEEKDREHQKPVVRVTSFEGAKGLSAQHVIIAGIHNGEIPRDPRNIRDIEICKFLVGLTRTRKRCYLLYTVQFAGRARAPSTLLSWIASERYERVRVSAGYW